MNYKKIADIAHVSTSTVSKALSGSSEISEELAEHIRKIAIECGYFEEKKRRKREYTNNRSITVAVLVPELLGLDYPERVTSIKAEIERRGAHIAIYVYDFDQKKRDDILKNIVVSGTADGVIVCDAAPITSELQIPLVFVGGSPTSGYDSISKDTHALLSSCVGYLHSLGHTQIGFVGEPHTIGAMQAFKHEMEAIGLPINERFIHTIDARLEATGKEASVRIAALDTKPTAIIAAYDVVALSLIHGLSENGIFVPDDISVMGIGDISAGAYAQVPLTSVETYSREQYRTAVELLFGKIFKQDEAIRHITLEHRIIERASVKKIN